jgi:signal recognition particle subunit SRP54
MTAKEKDDPAILNSSRKKRIAAGSGTQVVDVNRLLKQFDAMKVMTKQISKGNMPAMFGGKNKAMGKRGLFGR